MNTAARRWDRANHKVLLAAEEMKMQAQKRNWFVAWAVGNGLASGLALAAAARGHWILALTLVAASVVFAGGMIKTMAAFRCGRMS